MTKYNAIIMNIVPITSKWHSFRLNGYRRTTWLPINPAPPVMIMLRLNESMVLKYCFSSYFSVSNSLMHFFSESFQ